MLPGDWRPQVENLELGATTESSLLVNTMVNFTNPTQYSASVPFVDLLLVYNSSKVAHLTARDVTIVPGTNTGVNVDLQWSPLDLGGPSAVLAGQDLLSRFVSGKLHWLGITFRDRLIESCSRLQYLGDDDNAQRNYPSIA